jgi:hypothetical protein
MVSVGPDLYVISNGLIHRWDGSVWNSSIGSALDGQINALATDGVNLYAAGFFRKAGADSCPAWAVGTAVPGIVSGWEQHRS